MSRKTAGHRLLVLLPVTYSLLPIACLLFIYGCGSAPSNRSDAEEAAIELNRKADSAFGNYNYKGALVLYGEALRVSYSIEHTDGIAANLMNMSVVYRKLGDMEKAHKCLDEILNSRHIAFGPSSLSEAAYIKAVLYVDEGKYPSAIEWTDKALNFCKDETCKEKGKIYNINAKIALINNTPESALIFGDRGLQWNRRFEDRQEEANSLRLLADAKTAANAYEEAKKFYLEALEIDKTLGFASKIATDLLGIGNILCRQGRQEEAAVYFNRAQSVSKSSGDARGTTLAEEIMGKCAK
jgi:tetratricopeptide (TPR) repeat protein